MKNGLKYLAVVGVLLLAGAGCPKTDNLPVDTGADKPSAEQKMPPEQKNDVDKAVDDAINGATSEAGVENEAADKDAAEVDADKTEMNSLKDANYETK